MTDLIHQTQVGALTGYRKDGDIFGARADVNGSYKLNTVFDKRDDRAYVGVNAKFGMYTSDNENSYLALHTGGDVNAGVDIPFRKDSIMRAGTNIEAKGACEYFNGIEKQFGAEGSLSNTYYYKGEKFSAEGGVNYKYKQFGNFTGKQLKLDSGRHYVGSTIDLEGRIPESRLSMFVHGGIDYPVSGGGVDAIDYEILLGLRVRITP